MSTTTTAAPRRRRARRRSRRPGACGRAGQRTPRTPPAAAKPNIVETAVAAGNFTTLVSLVKQAGLAETLSGTGPYTVFAPTDAAFKKVPKKTLKALGKDKAKLKAVLLYHVASGPARRQARRQALVDQDAQRQAGADPRPRPATCS